MLFFVGVTNDIGRIAGRGLADPVASVHGGLTRRRLATIAEAFRLTVEDHPDHLAVSGENLELTWSQLRDRSDAFAGTLAKLGVRHGDTVALMVSNRPEFAIADLAVMSLGATPFSIYLTSAPDQIAYVIKDAGAKVAIVEAPFARLVEPLVDHVLIAGEWDEEPRLSSRTGAPSQPDDLLTLIYTSGTTGPPKGVQITHANMMAAVDAVEQRVKFPDGSRVISWLPSAHVAERTAHHYLPIVFAMSVTCCPDPRRIGEWLPKVRPTWFFAVPRVWEKLKAGIEAKLAGDEGAQKLLAAGRQKVELEQAGQPIPDAAGPGPRRGRGEAVRAAAGRDRARRGQGRERRRRADPARRARVLPRDRRAAGRDLGDVRDLRRRRLEPARADQDRHRRPALAGRRAQARRGRRAAGALEGRDGRLPQPARTAPPKRSTTTAGCTPATSPRSTRTAT